MGVGRMGMDGTDKEKEKAGERTGQTEAYSTDSTWRAEEYSVLYKY
jgi:hypothetical protein